MRATLLGVGAMNSPRHAPAGLLVSFAGWRVMFDGGPGAEPRARIDAWLLTDERAELRTAIGRLAAERAVEPRLAGFDAGGLVALPLPVEHTSHPTVGYCILAGGRVAVWAPEFWTFPSWAAGADLMFADAAGWNRPIRFSRGAGGRASVQTSARAAVGLDIRRLIFAHIGRPALRAIDAGQLPPAGEWGRERHTYTLTVPAISGPATTGADICSFLGDLRDSQQAEQAIRLGVSAPTRPECLAEAVHALVGVQTGVTDPDALQRMARTAATVLVPETHDSGLLAGLLDQVIRRILLVGSVPVDVEVTEPQKGGLDVRLAVVPITTAVRTPATRVSTGTPPRLSDLSLRAVSGRWRATFTLDLHPGKRVVR